MMNDVALIDMQYAYVKPIGPGGVGTLGTVYLQFSPGK
jgi:hypothetical protein